MAHEQSQVADQVGSSPSLPTLEDLMNMYWHQKGPYGRTPLKDLHIPELKRIAGIARSHSENPNFPYFYLLREDQNSYKEAKPLACPKLILRLVRYILADRGEDISDVAEPFENVSE